MIPVERHRSILALLREQEVISISELTKRLQVSHMTIRRDISKLEAEGRVLSVTGGVQLSESLQNEESHDSKALQNPSEKESLSLLALKQIKDSKVIYLDAGTTILEIAKRIVNLNDLTVITNDFVIANYLISNSQCSIYHTGGKVDRANKSSVGNRAAQAIHEFNIDLAFVSTSSWNQRGISTPVEDKVVVKKAICDVSKACCLISDSSKYGKVAPFHAIDLERFDVIITDNNLSQHALEGLTQRGIDVLIAD
ncbi:DeoR/GlpR family DNA-binding transcription regulator [Vibrio sp. JC009]|uniref:DeoR/GlpR family DNA-binding transcription regulator n=1 Tax=Vibrio sp. JC009 TaxID=2912314 RepID=UPI0023AEA85A|nr:DeoR/GlpR family DNA-binding transcription regulator [Vibrio sp. JC009]WED24041.1 DeoR/GlpR family DNA-binding transcription regulator [Vibrio sp. JC009]